MGWVRQWQRRKINPWLLQNGAVCSLCLFPFPPPMWQAHQCIVWKMNRGGWKMLFRRVLLVLLLEPHCRSEGPSIHHISGDKRRAGTFPPKIYNHITSAYHLEYTIDGTGLTQLGTDSCTTYIHKVARYWQSGARGVMWARKTTVFSDSSGLLKIIW